MSISFLLCLYYLVVLGVHEVASIVAWSHRRTSDGAEQCPKMESREIFGNYHIKDGNRKCKEGYKKCYYVETKSSNLPKYYLCIPENVCHIKDVCVPGTECINIVDGGYKCECKQGTEANDKISCNSIADCASVTCRHAFCKEMPKSLPRWCYCPMENHDERAKQCEIRATSATSRILTGDTSNVNIKEETNNYIFVHMYKKKPDHFEHSTFSMLEVGKNCTIRLKYYPDHHHDYAEDGLLNKLKCYDANDSSEIYINQPLPNAGQVNITTPASITDYWKCEIHFIDLETIPVSFVFRAKYKTTKLLVHDVSTEYSLEDSNTDSDNMSTATLVGIIVAALGFLALVMWLIYRIYKRRQRLKLAQASSNLTYESLPGHREGPMALPPQWDSYARTHPHEDNIYSVPYAKNLEKNLYAKPLPKVGRSPRDSPSDLKTISLEDGKPTIGIESSRNAMPDRYKSLMKTNYMYDTSSQASEQDYVNVVPKRHKMRGKYPIPGNRACERDFETLDYVEPAYCEVPVFPTKK